MFICWDDWGEVSQVVESGKGASSEEDGGTEEVSICWDDW